MAGTEAAEFWEASDTSRDPRVAGGVPAPDPDDKVAPGGGAQPPSDPLKGLDRAEKAAVLDKVRKDNPDLFSGTTTDADITHLENDAKANTNKFDKNFDDVRAEVCKLAYSPEACKSDQAPKGGLLPLTSEQAENVEKAEGTCVIGNCSEFVTELGKLYPESKGIMINPSKEGGTLDTKSGVTGDTWHEHMVLETADGTIIDPLLQKQARGRKEYFDSVFESGVGDKSVVENPWP